jgi:hypothetical protein
MTSPVADPSFWSVPREWVGERCFILAGGASLPKTVIPRLRGRIIAIKQTVALRPDADVMFLAGRDDPETCREYFPQYRGPRVVCRAFYPGFPSGTLFLRRTRELAPRQLTPFIGIKKCIHWSPYSRVSTHVGGFDAGTSAINLAALFGAREIVLLGMDMRGGRWVRSHPQPEIPLADHIRHLAGIRLFAPELQTDRIRVVNTSPISAIDCFERQPIEAFL